MTSNNSDSHITSFIDIYAFVLRDYTLIFDLARLNNF